MAATGLSNGSRWEDAFTSLNAALHYAERCENITDIWVKEGLYLPTTLSDRKMSFRMNRPLKIYGGFPSSMENPQMVDRDPAMYATTLSGAIGGVGNADNSQHILQTLVPIDGLLVNGFTLSGGNADLLPSDAGGAIYNQGFLTLEECIIRDNLASAEAMQIYNVGAGARLVLKDCIIVQGAGSMEDIKNDNNAEITILGGVTIQE